MISAILRKLDESASEHEATAASLITDSWGMAAETEVRALALMSIAHSLVAQSERAKIERMK